MECVLQLLDLGDKMCSLWLALFLTFIYFSCGRMEINPSILSDEGQY